MASDAPETGTSERRKGREGWPRWSLWILLSLILASILLPGILNREDRKSLDYSVFIAEVSAGTVNSVEVTNETGTIQGELLDGDLFTTKGPVELPDVDLELLRGSRLGFERGCIWI